MIKHGCAIYIDKNNRLFSRRSKNRTFLGWSYDKREMEEGIRIDYPTMTLISPYGFGMERKEEEGDYKILVP